MVPFKKKSLDTLHEDLERVKLEEEIANSRAEKAEREAIISQLKEQYGSGWQKILGVGKLSDLLTLRSFLKGSKNKLQKQTSHSSLLSPVTSGSLARFRRM